MSSRVEKNEKIAQKIEQEEKKEIRTSHLKKVLKVFIIFMILSFSLFYYMRFIETKMLLVKEVKIEHQMIPTSLSGLKIVHFSDLHYQMTTEKKELKALAKEIQKLKPDILVFTGDLLDENIEYNNEDYKELTKHLKDMEATLAKYYVKGNHDYYTNQTEEILENANFISLNNKSDTIYGDDNQKIYINGMGSFMQNDFDSETAFAAIEDAETFTISLFHEPDNILELKDKHINLALAGHSHNSQVKLPYISTLFSVEGAKIYYENHYTVNNTELYINSGIGTSMHRFRLLAPPTINLYRIVKSSEL